MQNPEEAQALKAFVRNGYVMNLVALDHLLTGRLKGVLTIAFIQLQNDETRDILQIRLRFFLTWYSFQNQSVLY